MSRSGHRFFVDPALLRETEIRLQGDAAHQIARVLRLRPGDAIVLLDGSGEEVVAELTDVTAREISGTIRARRRNEAEPTLRVMLYQALLQREKMELVLQKSTEVGVAAILPIACQRSLVPKSAEADPRRIERWRRIVTEAAEQCRRGKVPEVVPPIDIRDALTRAVADGPSVVAWEGENQQSVRSALRSMFHQERTPLLSIFVGPEGGFADEEIALARQLGATTVSLGPRVLRTETAGPVLAALALYEAGEMDLKCGH